MDTAKKILLFSVGIILTVGFIAIGMTIFNRSRTSISNTSSQYDSLVSQYSDIEYSFYEGDRSSASGSEVTRLIKGMKDNNVVIYVKNGMYLDANGDSGQGVKFEYNANDCGYSGNTTSFDNAVKFMADRNKSLFYVNPMASFSCVIVRDANGSVSSLTFTQK